MRRRTFLTSSLAATCLPWAASTRQASSAENKGRQFFEWRRWHLQDQRQYELTNEFLQQSALPALKRMGIGPVGVFTEMESQRQPSLYALLPYDSLDQMLEVRQRLPEDDAFVGSAEKYLGTDKDSPAFQRIENQLMIAFEGMPTVKIPRTGPRIFELRVYESHSEVKAALKVEMFNSGEFDIFADVNLDPVFFGQTIVGSNLPNLTYMLAYKDMQEHDEAWDAFRVHPDWLVLRDDPRYQDTVSKIISTYLKPTDYSQI